MFTVFRQVLILFLMASAGFAAGKRGMVSENGAKDITSILFYIVTPALIVTSMQDNIGTTSLASFGKAWLLSVLGMAVSILTASFFFRKKKTEQRRVLQFASAYSNCGFIGLPLVQAALGSRGVMYASVFIAVYNLIVWTHGVSLMRGQTRLEWKYALLNPGVIGLAVGFPLFAAGLRLPDILLMPLQGFSDLNSPLAMIVIGYYISKTKPAEIFGNRSLYALSAVRLLVVPAVCLGILYLLRVDTSTAMTVLILTAAPSGVNTALFSAQFDGETKLASGAVALTTLLSIVTLPLITGCGSALL